MWTHLDRGEGVKNPILCGRHKWMARKVGGETFLKRFPKNFVVSSKFSEDLFIFIKKCKKNSKHINNPSAARPQIVVGGGAAGAGL